MLGLAALGLTALMIYTLVKNALKGKQLSKNEGLTSSIELILPLTSETLVFEDSWRKSFQDAPSLPGQVKIYVLVDGHHPSLYFWQEIQSRFQNIEIHNFPMRPTEAAAIPWMISQISPKISAPIVVIGDASIVPSAQAFSAVSKLVAGEQKSFVILPQTAHLSLLGETIAALNPTLAFASFFGHKKWRRKVTSTMAGISEAWITMSSETFGLLDLNTARFSEWKEAVIHQWQVRKHKYSLAFGEKFLKRYYSPNLTQQLKDMVVVWEHLWNRIDRKGFGFYVAVLFLWSFPVICFMTHPFWSLASFFLLLLYRFFSKIVFQESWSALFLHPIGCMAWLGSLFWWAVNGLKTKYGSQASK